MQEVVDRNDLVQLLSLVAALQGQFDLLEVKYKQLANILLVDTTDVVYDETVVSIFGEDDAQAEEN